MLKKQMILFVQIYKHVSNVFIETFTFDFFLILKNESKRSKK